MNEVSPHIESNMTPDRGAVIGGDVSSLDIEDILELLPQRQPHLFIDRVISLVPGVHAVGVKMVTGNECGLAKRKHGFVFPASFALEVLVQLATIVHQYPQRFGQRYDAGLKGRLAEGEPRSVDDFVRLHSVESCEVKREMVVGDRLYAAVSLLGRTSVDDDEDRPLTQCAGQVHLAGEPYVEATFTLAG